MTEKINCSIFHFLGIVRSNYIFEQKCLKLRKFWNFQFDRLSIALKGAGPLVFYNCFSHGFRCTTLYNFFFDSTNVQVLSNKIWSIVISLTNNYWYSLTFLCVHFIIIKYLLVFSFSCSDVIGKISICFGVRACNLEIPVLKNNEPKIY